MVSPAAYVAPSTGASTTAAVARSTSTPARSGSPGFVQARFTRPFPAVTVPQVGVAGERLSIVTVALAASA
jgi:hypothetical protein